MAETIGFIGVGTMGEPMCRNLARKSGATVLATDRNREPLQRLAADGVKTASLDEIVAGCRTIFLSLPGGKEVEEVCLGPGGILSQVTMGYTVIDTSTAPVSIARRLYAEFEGKACAFAVKLQVLSRALPPRRTKVIHRWFGRRLTERGRNHPLAPRHIALPEHATPLQVGIVGLSCRPVGATPSSCPWTSRTSGRACCPA